WHIVGFSVYGMTLFLMFLCSSLHHGVKASDRVEHWLRQFDYFSIFLLIAGSMTPFCLVLMRNPIGWAVMGVTWFLAITGVIIKWLWPTLPKWVTLTLYMCMGWMTLMFLPAIWSEFPFTALVLMGLGGLLYTIGGIIFICEKPNPVAGVFGFHEIWHVFVVAASCAHYAFMYGYMLPY
ncbi:MAG: hemolysin III family protein, partial [Verrucomicrobia bacterium]|nr:hemolysin III family protein [Verrucomicrobiota bacterium]